MKYVILIHSNPQPWGHPTEQLTDEGRAQSQECHDAYGPGFDALMEEINASGEFVTARRWPTRRPARSTAGAPSRRCATDGPYAESKEQLAGFFLIDCETRERAEEIAAHFAQPGGTIELRPAMWGDGDDQ